MVCVVCGRRAARYLLEGLDAIFSVLNQFSPTFYQWVRPLVFVRIPCLVQKLSVSTKSSKSFSLGSLEISGRRFFRRNWDYSMFWAESAAYSLSVQTPLPTSSLCVAFFVLFKPTFLFQWAGRERGLAWKVRASYILLLGFFTRQMGSHLLSISLHRGWVLFGLVYRVSFHCTGTFY